MSESEITDVYNKMLEDLVRLCRILLVNGKLYLSHLGKKGNEYLSHPTKPL